MKKLLAITLSALMLISLCFTAFAAGTDTNGSVTVTNATIGQTYTAYKVFDLTYAGDEQATNADGTMADFTGAVSYSYTKTGDNDALYKALTDGITEGEGDAQTTTASPFTLTATTVNNLYNVGINSGVTTDQLVAFMKKLEVKGLLTAVTATAENSEGIDTATGAATATTVKWKNLGLGYYYVTGTLGSVVTIDSTLKDVNIIDKNVAPTVVKKIIEDDVEMTWNTASFGDVVDFKITVKAHEGAENYVLNDYVPTSGADSGFFTLMLNNATGSDELEYFYGTVNGGTYSNAAVAFKKSGNDYNLLIGNTKIGTMTVHEFSVYNDKFVITFEQSFLDTVSADTDIVINYSARLEEASGSNYFRVVNNTYLTYGKSATQSQPSSTLTYAYKFDIFKYTGANTALAGAEFELKDANGNVIKFDDAMTLADGTSQYVVNTDDGAVSKVVSPASGTIRIRGLAAGTYTLTETKAPDGYNALTAPITVSIDTSGNIKYHMNDTSAATWKDAQSRVEVLNNTGSELPATGGVGTAIFYIAGGVLVAGAVIFFVVRRRLNSENKAK